ncbi:MAG TPA: UDP-N-acetylglucosamine 2-epimerase (non-hydrolyzing) [Planctomycetota bacterium]|nr:UDP-N-acetylglucosamine 2-epimerase (non-hydrolyzing) [Planctomycetota bacterium]
MSLLIDVVAGARPNFMKVAPLLRELAARGGPLQGRLVHTGQHYDEGMSEVFFRQLGIPEPEVRLGAGSGTHGEQTAKILSSYERHLMGSRPRGVVVVGDVNSTLACSLAAAKLGIPVAHVEAGLRSFDRRMPEEINRVVTDAIADLLLVSEPVGLENLAREGVPKERVHFVGNLMIDSLEHSRSAARRLGMPARMGLQPGNYALVTLHRPSNVDLPERLAQVVEMLGRTSQRLPIVFPVHPRTRDRLEKGGLMGRVAGFASLKLLSTLGYEENLALMETAKFVLTDSGGIQEETSYLGVPCLTLRPNTERPITVSFGTNIVVGEDLGEAEGEIGRILEGHIKKGKPIDGWDGHAAIRAVDALETSWGKS